MRLWFFFGMNFTCFSHTCSNSVFAYFFLGCFSNVWTLSKHGIFKKHCFSWVKTLFWRIRLCRRNLRIFIFGGGIVPCFLLNFHVFWRVFRHICSLRFLGAFLIKNRSKMSPKLSGAPPPFFDLFRGRNFWWYFCWFWLRFWRPFGTLWAHFGALLAQIGSLLAPFGLILVPFWFKLGPFWCHVGPDFGYFAPSGFRCGSFWAKFIF